MSSEAGDSFSGDNSNEGGDDSFVSTASTQSHQGRHQEKLLEAMQAIQKIGFTFQSFVVGSIQSTSPDLRLTTTKWIRSHASAKPESYGPMQMLTAISEAVSKKANAVQKKIYFQSMARQANSVYTDEIQSATKDEWLRGPFADLAPDQVHGALNGAGNFRLLQQYYQQKMPCTMELLGDIVGVTQMDDATEAEDPQSPTPTDSDPEANLVDEGDLDDEEQESLSKRELCVVSAISSLLNGRSQNVNRFQMVLGMTFGLLRVPGAAIQILNRCGITVSSRTISRTMETISNGALSRARRLMKDHPGRTALLFDNVNIYVRHSIQSTMSANSSIALTSRTMFGLPSECDPLTPSKLAEVLRLDRKGVRMEMFDGLSDFFHAACKIQIATVLVHSLQLSVERKRSLLKAIRTRITKHSVHKLSASATPVVPLKLLNLNEGTVEGTRGVLEQSMNALGLSEQSPSAFVVTGDLLSVLNVHAARDSAQWERTPLARLETVYPVSGPWHLLLNWLYMMFHIYGNTNRATSLDRHRQLLGRGKTELDLKKPQFDEGWRLLRHVWAGKVLCLTRRMPQVQEIDLDHWEPSSKDFFDAIERLVKENMDASAIEQTEGSQDDETRATRLFLRDCVLGWEYNDAIHEGDIGRMASTEKLLALSFFGAGQTKYGALLLDRMLEDEKTPQTATALRAAQLVNISGKPNRWQGADHYQEILNGRLKMYPVNHSPNQAVNRYEDRISAFVGIGEDLLEGMRKSMGLTGYHRRKHEQLVLDDVRLVAKDAASLSQGTNKEGQKKKKTQEQKPKEKVSALDQARSIWLEDDPKEDTARFTDLIEEGYNRLIKGALSRYQAKSKDYQNRDIDVCDLATGRHSPSPDEDIQDNDGDVSLREERVREAEQALIYESANRIYQDEEAEGDGE
ncbi:hypothetical protein A4X13_0g7529 [Tilletia indica]|uniref:DUF6589 domain-containing protein n=1 Tax=Tilletia indica TaxID=43049 RepID=A0A8T8SJH4_9BASI|nr:hypothetical protein A4X13_0g7529 [Tilletia indica]